MAVRRLQHDMPGAHCDQPLSSGQQLIQGRREITAQFHQPTRLSISTHIMPACHLSKVSLPAHLLKVLSSLPHCTHLYFSQSKSSSPPTVAMIELESISINGNTVDPAAPAIKALGLGSDDPGDKLNYILVQTTGVLTKVHKEALGKVHVKIQERVGDKTYLCRYEPEKLKPVRDLDFVKWASIYSTHFVVSPTLKAATPAPGLGSMAVLATHPHTVDIVCHHDYTKDTESLKKDIAQAAHVDASQLSYANHKIRVTVQERYLEDVARIDEVKSIVEVRPNKLFNNIARNILMGNGGVADQNDIVIGSVTFRGQGQLIAVADTGVDSDHPAFAGRIKETFALGRPGPNGSTSDPQGHGTHVCGSVLGDAVDKAGDRIQGVAPEAQLIMQSIGDSQGALVGIPNDLNSLFQQAYKAGARVHSNSWGDSQPAQRYEQNAREIDQFIHEHPEFVICFVSTARCATLSLR